jgi:hypothetical protein
MLETVRCRPAVPDVWYIDALPSALVVLGGGGGGVTMGRMGVASLLAVPSVNMGRPPLEPEGEESELEATGIGVSADLEAL